MTIPRDLPKSLQFALFRVRHIHPSGDEQATGLGILAQQTRIVLKASKLNGWTHEQRILQVQKEIAELAKQYIATFEISSTLTSSEQEEIIKQVQAEITRQAREEIMELALEHSSEDTKIDVIDSEQLVMALVEFSVLERKSTYDLQVLKINTIVVRLEEELRRIAGEKIVFEIKLSPDLWWASFDPEPIRIIIINLVINACEAMPEGGHLTIETSNIVLDSHQSGIQPGEYVLLTVRDTGYGISDGIKSQIFEPFFTTKNDKEHQGLGLAMVFGIVKQFDGHVKVYSEEGAGAIFKIYLPRVPEPEPQPEPEPPQNLLEANIGVRNLVKQRLIDFAK